MRERKATKTSRARFPDLEYQGLPHINVLSKVFQLIILSNFRSGDTIQFFLLRFSAAAKMAEKAEWATCKKILGAGRNRTGDLADLKRQSFL